MGNLYVNLPVPTGNGVGAAVDMSGFGAFKTIQMNGSWSLPNRPSTITIEMNNDAAHAGTWAPVCTFFGSAGPGQVQIVTNAAKWFRVRISNYRGGADPVVQLGGTDDGSVFAAIPATAADGTGAAVDISDMPALKTLQIGNTFTGTCILETSEDAAGVNWAQVAAFQAPGQHTWTQAAYWARLKRVNTKTQPGPGTPVATLGATTPGAGGGGGSGSSLLTATLVNDSGVTCVVGTCVYSKGDGTFDKADASALAKSARAIGLVFQVSGIADGDAGPIVTQGPFPMTTAQWDVITGDVGGLVFNTEYYVDATTPGKLTSVAPVVAGQVVKPIGYAVSTTVLIINPWPSVLLS